MTKRLEFTRIEEVHAIYEIPISDGDAERIKDMSNTEIDLWIGDNGARYEWIYLGFEPVDNTTNAECLFNFTVKDE